MKKPIAILLAAALTVPLCGCTFVRDMARERGRESLRENLGDDAASYYDYAMEQYDQELEELGDLQDQLSRQLQKQLEAEWDRAMDDVEDDIRSSVEENWVMSSIWTWILHLVKLSQRLRQAGIFIRKRICTITARPPA